MQVHNHVLRYVFRLGDRMKILKIPQLNVTDDKYHTVVVKREGNYASLQIDYDGKVEGTTGGLHKLLNMGGGSFFTGGLPNITEVRYKYSYNVYIILLTEPFFRLLDFSVREKDCMNRVRSLLKELCHAIQPN